MGKRGGVSTKGAVRLSTRLLCSLWVLGSSLAWAAPAIYTCVDSNGKRLTSDRPIPECLSRDQRLLNSDGSVRKVLPPTPTADERAQQEAREREAAAERAKQQEAVRRDRSLLHRYPNEAAHNKARAAALDDVHAALQVSDKRLAALALERKPLMEEAQFFTGRQWPLKLRLLLDANDAATEAQRVLIQNQQAEMVRINANYDAELDRLKKLWSGAPPGSLGALPTTPAASAAKKTAAK